MSTSFCFWCIVSVYKFDIYIYIEMLIQDHWASISHYVSEMLILFLKMINVRYICIHLWYYFETVGSALLRYVLILILIYIDANSVSECFRVSEKRSIIYIYSYISQIKPKLYEIPWLYIYLMLEKINLANMYVILVYQGLPSISQKRNLLHRTKSPEVCDNGQN